MFLGLYALGAGAFVGCGSSDGSEFGNTTPPDSGGEGDGNGSFPEDDAQSFADSGPDPELEDARPDRYRPNDDTREGYCAGRGAPSFAGVGDGGRPSACNVAKTTFRYALCSCEGLVASNTLKTDAFDSTKGVYDPAAPLFGGSVGTNGNFSSNATVDVGGSLWVSSTSGITLGAASFTRAEFHSGGYVSTGPAFTVDGNARIADNWNANGNLTITGSLTYPTGKTLNVGGTKMVQSEVRAPVSVPPPCDCSPEQRLDVVGLVEAFATKSDNAVMGISADALKGVATETTLEVPCGRLYLSEVTTSAKVTLKLAGRTAIFIDGHFAAGADFVVDAPPGSEVDVFVAGNVVASGEFSIGSVANPANARIYVGGTGTINLSASNLFAGNLYAPQSELVLAGDTTIYGAVFVRRVATSNALTIHFDESILTRPDDCDATPEAGCGSCRDCGNQACIAGQCTSCTDSSQCCSPLVCRSGKCVPPSIK